MRIISTGDTVAIPVPTFGENLMRLRGPAGFATSKALADQLEISASVVSRWETNQTGLPESPTLFKLAKALDCSIEDLLRDVDPEYAAALARREARRQKRDEWIASLPPDRAERLRHLDQNREHIDTHQTREQVIAAERRAELREQWITPVRNVVLERHLDFFIDRAAKISGAQLWRALETDSEQRHAFGERIREERHEKGWSTAYLAKELQISERSVIEFEAGEYVSLDDFSAIFAAFVVMDDEPVGVLLTQDLEWFVRTLDRLASAPPSEKVRDDTTGEVIDVSRYRKHDVPVFGHAEATRDGLIAWSDEGIVKNQVDHWISRPWDVPDTRAYGMVVRGDSMVPRYFPGETIIASPNAILKSGNFACVQLRTGERMIKRVYRQEGGWNLTSINESYAPKFVADTDIAAIHKIVHNSHDA